MGEGAGDVDTEGAVVGTGEPERVQGGDDDAASCELNSSPGVVMYRGWLTGSVATGTLACSGSTKGPGAAGLMLGCAISFHTLGLTCDRMLLMADGRCDIMLAETDAVLTTAELVLTGTKDPGRCV